MAKDKLHVAVDTKAITARGEISQVAMYVIDANEIDNFLKDEVIPRARLISESGKIEKLTIRIEADSWLK